MTHPLLPSLLPHFPAAEGELTVGGLRVSRLAKEFGTPLYVYDAAILRARLDMLRAQLPWEIFYSVKANPAVAPVFAAMGAGLEVASAGEYLRARAAGAPPERIVFAGPGKTEEELRFVVGQGIGEIHVESKEEISLLGEMGGAGGPIKVLVRINPKASGGAMRMGGQPSPFGFDEEIIEDVVRDVRARPGLAFEGIHVYAATQVLDAQVLVEQWSHAIPLGRHVGARTVDLGGGLGIPYFAGEAELDLAVAGAGARVLHRAELRWRAEEEMRTRRAGRERQRRAVERMILEPGRFLAGPAGVYLARVLSVKESRGRTFVVLDGGMHHHLAASGNLGQVVKRDFPLVNASRAGEQASVEATVVGPLCTPLDTLAREAHLPPTRPGDLVAILQSGAYGLTASPVGFLSHPMPAEVLVDGGVATALRSRGTFERPITDLH